MQLNKTCGALLVGLLMWVPAVVQAQKWDMPLAYSASNYHSENAARFANAVTGATGGSLEIVTHPGGSLFKGNEIFRAVRTGQVVIGERLISALGNEDPLFEIDALPFLATSFEDAWRLYQAVRPQMNELLADRGLHLLYAVPWPPQGLYAKRPVRRVTDMRGVKFRAYNQMTSRLAELMGALPTQIEAAELSQAFATGVADSMISSGSTGYDRKLWEHVDHWYDVQAWLPKNMVVVNAEAWQALDPEIRGVVSGAAAMAEQAGWVEARRLADWYKEQLAGNGMQVGPADPGLVSDFQAIGTTLTAEWLQRAGDRGAAAIEAYRAN